MGRVVVDSDDEEASLEEEYIEPAELEHTAAPQDVETSNGSNGSTDKLLREAHNAISAPIPSTSVRKRKRDVTDESTETPVKTRRLKMNKQRSNSEGPIKGKADDRAVKSSQTGKRRRDDWDVPSSSSPVRGSCHSPPTQILPSKATIRLQADDIDLPRPKLCSVPRPESTLVDSSSSLERRVRDAQELGQAGTSSLSTYPSFHDQGPGQMLSQPKQISADGSQVTVHVTEPPQSEGNPVVILPHSSILKRGSGAETRDKSRTNTPTTPAPSTRGKRAKALHVEEADNDDGPDELTLSDELAAQGLQKECYVPRPSRSRSMGTSQAVKDEEIIELPRHRSSKAKNGSKRRRKTEGEAADEHSQSGSQKVEALVELGFSPKRVQGALKEVEGDKDAAANLLLNATPVDTDHDIDKKSRRSAAEHLPRSDLSTVEKRDLHDELQEEDVKKVAPSKNGRRSKRVLDEEDDDDTTAENEKGPEDIDSKRNDALETTHGDASIPPQTNSRKRGRPRKNEDRQTTTAANKNMDQEVENVDELAYEPPDNDKVAEADDTEVGNQPADSNSAITPAPVAVSTKPNKPRGRPKKSAQQTTAPTDDPEPNVGADETVKPSTDDIDIYADTKDKVNLADDDASSAKQSSSPFRAGDEKENAAPTSSKSSDDASKASLLGQTQTSKVEPGKGRVPLRVGLSKRLRIPSLLRSAVKKT